MIYHLALGGNLGDRARRLARAKAEIGRAVGRIRKESSLYLTQPVGRRDQPWFLNQALEVESRLSPVELLAAVKDIERRMGRTPGPRNGPRRIDIDILLAGPTILRTPRLTIPHPRLAERRFVLVPLAEIAARRRDPRSGMTIAALKRACPDRSIVVGVRKSSPDRGMAYKRTTEASSIANRADRGRGAKISPSFLSRAADISSLFQREVGGSISIRKVGSGSGNYFSFFGDEIWRRFGRLLKGVPVFENPAVVLSRKRMIPKAFKNLLSISPPLPLLQPRGAPKKVNAFGAGGEYIRSREKRGKRKRASRR